jgi:hypothetical protein
VALLARTWQSEGKQGDMETQGTFRTEDLPFAAYLHAAHQLRFLGCELVDGIGRIAFTFSDPDGKGNQMNIEFESGAECPAVTFYDSIRHLRRVMDRTRSKEQHEYEAPYC